MEVRVQSRAPLTRMSTQVAVRNLLYTSFKHFCGLFIPLDEPVVIRKNTNTTFNSGYSERNCLATFTGVCVFYLCRSVCPFSA